MVRRLTPQETARRDLSDGLNGLVEGTIANAYARRNDFKVPYDPLGEGDTNQFTVEEMRGAGIKDPEYR
jgi:hypothetical protein